jgi:hypothetical protein
MKASKLSRGIFRLHLVLLIGAISGLGAVSWAVWAEFFEEASIGVGLTGIQHMGTSYKIDEFNVNGIDGGNVGWEGGGGSSSCCVRLPRKWRPGLTVMVRWAVGDWSKANRRQTATGDYTSVSSGGMYRAVIPVEKYADADDIYVHFFAGGKARVVSSSFGRGNHHPILDDDAHAVDLATTGAPVDQLFTNEELTEVQRRADERRKRNGDWR